MNNSIQPLLPHGYIWYTGQILSNTTVDAYNRYTVDINAARYPATREQLLDNRHKFIVRVLSSEVTA